MNRIKVENVPMSLAGATNFKALPPDQIIGLNRYIHSSLTTVIPLQNSAQMTSYICASNVLLFQSLKGCTGDPNAI